jgi:hypothetical protein
MALIREYDPTTDHPALRRCFVELYLKKNWAVVHQTLDSEVAIDCVVNRTTRRPCSGFAKDSVRRRCAQRLDRAVLTSLG